MLHRPNGVENMERLPAKENDDYLIAVMHTKLHCFPSTCDSLAGRPKKLKAIFFFFKHLQDNSFKLDMIASKSTR